MFQADTIANDKLHQIAADLGRWLDPLIVTKFRAAIADANQPIQPAENESLSMADTGADAPELDFKLGETFALWALGADDIMANLDAGRDLLACARSLGRYHHQLKLNQQAVAFSRARALADADFEVRQLYISPLAGQIDKAIKWLDQYGQQHQGYAATYSLVRLLYVPANQVHAFWLIDQQAGKSQVLIIDAPNFLEALRPLTLLSTADFLAAFRGKHQLGGLNFGLTAR